MRIKGFQVNLLINVYLLKSVLIQDGVGRRLLESVWLM